MKHVYTLAPELPFLDALAARLWRDAAGDAQRLSDTRLFLPTRRACRMLREAFLALTSNGAALLPCLQPLGDVDDDELLFADPEVEAGLPPALHPMRRRFLLARLIRQKDSAMPLDQAAQLADALGKFLDEAYYRRVSFSALPGLVQKRELAQHWQETVRFLSILTEHWPAVLAAEGAIDAADRRNRVLQAQAAIWRANPPAYPVMAAGSTGSMPATAELLDVIAGLPQGAVILPGLDRDMDEASWQEMDEQHPQYGMRELLGLMKLERRDVREWAPSPGSPRRRLLAEAMRPAATTDEWRHLRADDVPANAASGLTRATFAHAQEEAQAIALMVRQGLIDPSHTIALVTPDRQLAERVAALLERWNIRVNDSGGQALAATMAGAFLSSCLNVMAPEPAAVEWLSFLKNPLAACGLPVAECRARAREVEMRLWRSDRPADLPWFNALAARSAPWNARWAEERHMPEWLADHVAFAEAAAETDREGGRDRLWRGEEGEALTGWLDDIRAATADFPPMDGETYRSLFALLLRQSTYRPSRGLHPRVHILGPLEARLMRADLVILGGMNEGVWPPEIAADPWMSRPMRRDFGLAPAEYRIGLNAHDFVQLALAPRVIMTRALRSGGAPTVPSRFVLQIETVLRALGHMTPAHDILADAAPWAEWARLLDEPDSVAPVSPPAPRPPVEWRPSTLSVSDIGVWLRNPYAVYAKHVLGLRKLEDLDAEPDASDRGNMIHAALEKFIRAYPDHLPADAAEQLIELGRKEFSAFSHDPRIQAFWWPRFERIARWFVAHERERRAAGVKTVAVETAGQAVIGRLTLKGRADRIDRLPDGKLAIIDYKTGAAPAKKDVQSGLEPQLPLLALLASRGALKDVPPDETGELAYWKLGGGHHEASNRQDEVTKDIMPLALAAEQGLNRLVAAFADPATPYEAVPKPSRAPRFDDYSHLARLAEWGRTRE